MAELVCYCPQCGAQLPQGDDCRALFNRCLALEFEHPGTYGSEHFLTVTCYLLQHNGYSKDGWLQARAMLSAYLREGITPDVLRRRARQALDQRQRSWGVTKDEKSTQAGGVFWSSSIADVRTENAETYCADVRDWAKAVLQDVEFLKPEN